MSGYNISNNPPNFSEKPVYAKTAPNYEFSNLSISGSTSSRFQTNYPPYFSYEASNDYSGNQKSTSFINLSTNYSTLNASGPWACPSGPYQMTIAQLCNPDMFFEVRSNAEAWSSGTLDSTKIRSYWINVPYGNAGAFGGSGALDAQLWQAWKGTFGFDKIPVGFGVGFSLGIKPGTEINVIVGDYNSNPYGTTNYAVFNRQHPATYITNSAGTGPYGIPRSIRNLPSPTTQTLTSSFTMFYEAPNQAVIYEPSADVAFAANYPALYTTPASALPSNLINRPQNALL